ncbi:mRNA guanylyltransferase, partial [Phenoliferia sp. Uapishka_3]
MHVARPVPERIPGDLITDPERLHQLKTHLATLCGLQSLRFPGSQPVSFDRDSLQLLEREDFWVCEKSDGVRVLVLIVATPEGQEVYLIDRKEDFYQNYGLTFPHQDGPEYNHSNTVLDGEMVIDVDPETGERLKLWVVNPYLSLLSKMSPEMSLLQPFEVKLKKQELSYGIEDVFKVHLPKLKHGNDGLIFTSAEAPYTPGTDRKILKWKPPSENSIDFLLQVKFPALPDRPDEVDLYAKPRFMLMMNHGKNDVRFFDTMEVEDETWEEWKRKGDQYDDRVVEVVWNKDRQTWEMLRFRDDKREGNFHQVVTSILKSIQHGVEADELIAHAGKIKHAWKTREYQRSRAGSQQQPPRPQQQQQRPQGLVVGGLKR